MSEQVRRFYIMPSSVPVLLSCDPAYTPMTNHLTDVHTVPLVLATDYDALHAEAEALRVVLHEIASVNPAHRGIEWAKSYASDGLKGSGSELYARWLDTFKEAEALRDQNRDLRIEADGWFSRVNGVEAKLEALRAENAALRESSQDVRSLVEALEECAASLAWNCLGECRAIHAGPIMPAAMALDTARAALSTHRQAQPQ